MKKILFILLLSTIFAETYSQVSLAYLNHYQLTPNTQDTSGVFCRIFYHQGHNKFYVVYASRALVSPPGFNQYYRWEEYNSSFIATGLRGTLSGFTGGVGDYGMVMVNNSYYHVTGTGIGPAWQFRLSKYDENFNLVTSVSFSLDSADSKADLMLNYSNGKLIIGAFHQTGSYHPNMPMQSPSWTPNMHKWEYDTSLVSVATPAYLNETFTTWGSSCVFNNNQYNIVTFYKFQGHYNPNYNLNVYRYDSNWSYIDSVPLNNDGQWSQGVLWDGNYYYVAYHSGHLHRSGNITLGMYDINWNLVYDTTITNNAVFDTINNNPPLNTVRYNANRPYVTKLNDTLYVSYDQDDYKVSDYFPVPLYTEGNRWQAHVMKFKINGTTGINEILNSSTLTVFPNPFSSQTVLHSDNYLNNATLTLVNCFGQTVKQIKNISGQTITLFRDNFPSALYFLRLTEDNKTLAVDKLVITD